MSLLFRSVHRWYSSRNHSTAAEIFHACQTLGVSYGANAEEVKEKYKKLVATNHPDLPGGSETVMRKINTAYEVLKNNEHRMKDEKQDAQKKQSAHTNYYYNYSNDAGGSTTTTTTFQSPFYCAPPPVK